MNGVTTISVPNDYYIVNDEPEIMKLPLDQTAIIELQLNSDAGKNNNDLPTLKKTISGPLYTLTLKEGRVVKLSEIFIP